MTCGIEPWAKKPSCEIFSAKICQFFLNLPSFSNITVFFEPDNEVVSLQTFDSGLEDVSLQGLLVFEKVDLIKPDLYDLGHSIFFHLPYNCFLMFPLIRVSF